MSTSTPQVLQAEAGAAGRLDRFLAEAFPQISRSRFQSLIAEGQVSVEGQAITLATS
jgi:23S rRNA pseudouridine1911/1915/1917 synthase